MAEFDFDEDSRRSRRRSGREVSHSRSAFGTMFGASMGCLFAVGLVICLAIGGCVALFMIGSQHKPTESTPIEQKAR